MINKFFNYLFKGVVFWAYILIILKIASYPIEFIFFDNSYAKYYYLGVWINLFKEIINIEFFSLKSFGRQLLYLPFLILHYLIYKLIIIIFNSIKPYIILFPKKIFAIFDKLFPIK